LDGVLRFFGVAGDHAGHAEGHVLIAPDELLDGVLAVLFGS